MASAKLKSLLQGSQILLPFICFALGASMLGISAHILAFTHEHRHTRVHVRDNSGFFPWPAQLPYLPKNFSLTRPIVLLITGLLCTLANLAVITLLLLSWRTKPSPNGKKRTNPTLPTILLDTLALLLVLAITIYAWNSLHLFPGDDSKPSNGPLKSNHGSNVHWDHETAFDPINWNCVAYPFVHREFGRELRGVCQEGLALVDLTVPLLILECVTLGLHFWFWRPNRKELDGMSKTDASAVGVESYRMDDFQPAARDR